MSTKASAGASTDPGTRASTDPGTRVSAEPGNGASTKRTDHVSAETSVGIADLSQRVSAETPDGVTDPAEHVSAETRDSVDPKRRPYTSDSDGVDLHLHSLHSDGVLPPAEVVDRAADGGVRLLALTDHDTVAGLPEAAERCLARGVRFVTGVELSATWNGQTIHVLGFDFDPAAPVLETALAGLQSQRRERLREIARRLERKRIGTAQVVVSPTQIVADIEARHAVVTRTHLARALVAAGAARGMGEVFKRLLGRGAPGHIASAYPALATTVECIKAAGGIAVLAHPLRYTLSAGARRRMLEEFRAAGGLGLEVVCGNARSHIDGLAQLARRFALDGSVGSDFHDPQLPWNPPGRLAKLPASVSPVWRHFRLPT